MATEPHCRMNYLLVPLIGEGRLFFRRARGHILPDGWVSFDSVHCALPFHQHKDRIKIVKYYVVLIYGVQPCTQILVYVTFRHQPLICEPAMHPSAMNNCKRFFDTYGDHLKDGTRVIDIGSLDVNGSLKSVTPKRFDYVGLDFATGKGVDILLTDAYNLPLESESADVIVSSSCFEHAEMFWLSFLEIMRVLKPDGLFYMNAPSNGLFHRYPVDCWRFYTDSGRALVTWGKRSNINPAMLESYTSYQDKGGIFNDFVGVFVKDEKFVSKYPKRITSSFKDFYNGLVYGSDDVLNLSPRTEDQKRVKAIPKFFRTRINVRKAG